MNGLDESSVAVRQVSPAPTAKVMVGAMCGAVSMIAAWCMKQFAHIDVPAEIAIAFSTVLSFAASYMTPPSARDHIVVAVTPKDDP